MPGIEELAAAVQLNCDLADAVHAQDLSLCTYLLQMREFFRWERDLPLDLAPDRGEVGRWIATREAHWEALAEQADPAFAALPIGEGVDAFDEAAANERLGSLGGRLRGRPGALADPSSCSPSACSLRRARRDRHRHRARARARPESADGHEPRRGAGASRRAAALAGHPPRVVATAPRRGVVRRRRRLARRRRRAKRRSTHHDRRDRDADPARAGRAACGRAARCAVGRCSRRSATIAARSSPRDPRPAGRLRVHAADAARATSGRRFTSGSPISRDAWPARARPARGYLRWRGAGRVPGASSALADAIWHSAGTGSPRPVRILDAWRGRDGRRNGVQRGARRRGSWRITAG